MKNSIGILHAISKTALYLILLTPILVWPPLFLPLLTPKILAFQALVEIAGAATLILALISEPSIAAPATAPRSRIKPLNAALCLLVGCSLVSSLFGISFRRSLWGFIERQDGLILVAHFLIWFLVLDRMPDFDNPRAEKRPGKSNSNADPAPSFSMTRYLVFSYWASIAVAVIALAEWTVFQFGKTTIGVLESMKTGRVGGTFGNPLFLGVFLLFHFFYGLAYIHATINGPAIVKPMTVRRGKAVGATRDGQKAIWKIVLLLAAQSIILIVMFLGQTRSILLGLAAGVLLLLIIAAVRSKGRLARATALGLLVAILLGSLALWGLRNSSPIKKVNVLYRLTHLSADENMTTRMRLLSWGSVLKGFPERPVLGFGHNNSYYLLNRYYNPEHVRSSLDFAESNETWFDKSHNAYIDLLVEKGILGILFFIAAALAAIATLLSITNKVLACCLGGGLVAYSISIFAAFDSFGSLFGLFLFLSCISVFGSRDTGFSMSFDRIVRRISANSGGRRPAGTVAGKLVFLAAIPLAMGGLYLNLEMARSSHGYAEARRNFAEDPYKGFLTYKEAFSHFSPYAAREKLMCAYQTFKSAIQQQLKPVTPDIVDYSLSLAEEAAAAFPGDVQVHLLRNDMFNGLGLYMDRKYFADAQAAGEKALALSPTRHEVIFNLGRTYLLTNQPASAVALNRRMVRDFTELPVAHWLLGLSLLADNQKPEAKEEIAKSLRMGYTFQSSSEREAIQPLFSEKELAELEDVKK